MFSYRVSVKTNAPINQFSLYARLFSQQHHSARITDSSIPFKIYQRGETIGIFNFPRIGRAGGWKGYLSLKYSLQISANPIRVEDPNWGLRNMELPSNLQIFCNPQIFWEINDPLLQSVAQEIAHPGLLQTTRAIYERVRSQITFREALPERLGAKRAFELQYGDCDEFTDLFITLCRILNIPARRITGLFMKREHEGWRAEHHAWAEIYSQELEQWIPMDIALGFFGCISEFHFAQKIESSTSNKPNFWFQMKTKKSASVHINLEPIKVVIN